MEKIITVNIKRISNMFDDIPIPSYATEGSSGMDVRAAIEGDVILEPFETKLIPTNLIFEIPKGYEGQIRPRSGLAINNSITILNSPGTIDSDYRGEVKIILTNLGTDKFIVHRGDRIAQLIICKVERVELLEKKELDGTIRNSGGFGHTGVK